MLNDSGLEYGEFFYLPQICFVQMGADFDRCARFTCSFSLIIPFSSVGLLQARDIPGVRLSNPVFTDLLEGDCAISCQFSIHACVPMLIVRRLALDTRPKPTSLTRSNVMRNTRILVIYFDIRKFWLLCTVAR